MTYRRRLQPRPLLTVALFAWGAVVVALTMLKAYYQIGYLWNPAAHHHRGLYLLPFSQLLRAKSIFGPVFDAVGNVALFIPVGLLLAMLWQGMPRLLRRVALAGFLGSVSIEVAQYLFALGYSDIDDVILNTVGATVGGQVAMRVKRWLQRLFVWGILAASAVFGVLVHLGPSLGDPAKVVG
ncbi:VanZ family protein [Corynebacterium sp. 13CS0277]|uniref:VanZ family protein n=1 Tax=Corynebacterium sp. 13CS0277 TaxID=2071994 RepID=UPI0013048F33|nr:VanZ family protein [Corynebacterium sp. 13CS0277]